MPDKYWCLKCALRVCAMEFTHFGIQFTHFAMLEETFNHA